MAAPYLGTPQPAQAHISGYLFDFDRTSWIGFTPDWMIATEAFRHLADVYALMPSANYFRAFSNRPPFQDGWLLDLDFRLLTGYSETREFLTRVKTAGGLGLDDDMWGLEQSNVHNLTDDWTAWNRPPQIFRLIGILPNITATRFTRVVPPEPVDLLTLPRQPDDSQDLAEYRAFLRPIVTRSLGDGTVTLVSASLGRFGGNGRADFSGVKESRWIEDFDSYSCTHTGITHDCAPALDRMVELVQSGYVVGSAQANQPESAQKASGTNDLREIVNVTASAPIEVRVENSAGVFTGPTNPDSLTRITYGLTEIGYWATQFIATLSLPVDISYLN